MPVTVCRDGLRGGRDPLGGTEGREVGREVGRLPGGACLVGAALRLCGGLRRGLGVLDKLLARSDSAVRRHEAIRVEINAHEHGTSGCVRLASRENVLADPIAVPATAAGVRADLALVHAIDEPESGLKLCLRPGVGRAVLAERVGDHGVAFSECSAAQDG